MKLEPRQANFCLEYIKDLNATQAAIRAGYSKKTAHVSGPRLLSNVRVQDRVAELRAKIERKLEISREKVMQEYARIAFSDVKSYFSETGSLINIKDLKDDASAAISSLESEEMRASDGEPAGTIKKIKLWDKKGALDSICKMLGYNEPEKINLTGDIIVIGKKKISDE